MMVEMCAMLAYCLLITKKKKNEKKNEFNNFYNFCTFENHRMRGLTF